MYAKSGQAVQVNLSNEVVLSADDQGATEFMLVGCRAWDTVSEALHPRCFSLVEADRPGWYVRHIAFFLKVDSESSPSNPANFDKDSSFILHSDTFYPGYYALESLNYPNYYVQSFVDGRLGIAERTNTTQNNDTASFMIADYSISGNSLFLCFKHLVRL